jgi:hypothetical protein
MSSSRFSALVKQRFAADLKVINELLDTAADEPAKFVAAKCFLGI